MSPILGLALHGLKLNSMDNLELISKIKRLFIPSSKERLIASLLTTKKNEINNSKKKILIQGVQSLYYFGMFGLVIGEIRKKKNVSVDVYHLRSLSVVKGSIFFNFVRLLFTNVTANFKWKHLYRAYSDGVAYSSASLSIFDPFDFYLAIKIWLETKSNEDLMELKARNIVIGDLVYDSYLRYRPSATINLQDPFLLVILWQALRDLRRAKSYFSKFKPCIYLTSYSTYIEHGIPLRVALHNQVKVFAITHYLHFIKELTLEDMSVVKNSNNYISDFEDLPNREFLLEMAEEAIKNRLSGQVDLSNSYMKKVPDKRYYEQIDQIKGSIVIFLHDFFDSPHCFKSMLFCDFYEWIVFTIDFLILEKIKFCVKPHPNQMPENLHVIARLRERYPNAVFIPDDISNKYLVSNGIIAGVTVYGSVAHELGYLGLPTIACGDNPHVPFYFCKTARDIKEYKTLLKEISLTDINAKKSKHESLIFYHMHYFNISNKKLDLLNLLSEWNRCTHEPSSDNLQLENLILKIRSSDEFKFEVNNLLVGN